MQVDVADAVGQVVRLALWRSRRGWARSVEPGHAESRVVARALTRFGALWHRLTGPLLLARVKRRLHLAAAALVAGVVAGMYWRGVAFEYRATWESTLLGATQVQSLLDWVLGPAARLLGVNVPDVAPLRAPGSGKISLKRVPAPGRESTSMRPPWPVSTRRAMGRPSPLPPGRPCCPELQML